MDRIPPQWVKQVVPDHILAIPRYVPGKPVAELQRELGESEAIKMASNENPLGPSPLALRAMAEHLRGLNVYPESSAPDLRARLGERFNLSPDGVILGNGSDEIMAMATHVFLQPGHEAVMPENAFSMYRICVQAFGGKAVTVPLRGFRPDLQAMTRVVNDRTRLVFLAIPNSPTGTVVSKSEFQAFLRDLPRGEFVLVLDEAYREYVRDSDCPEGRDYLEQEIPLLVLRTFSKIYGLAGLRIGYGIGPPWLIELLNRVRPPFNVNSLAQEAAAAALDDDDHVAVSRDLAHRGIDYLTAELTSLGAEVIPSEANFVAFCMNGDARSVYEGLLRRGIIVRHLKSFGMERYIRVTAGTDAQNVKFIEALRDVLRDAEAGR